jgi:hypothetical protein
VVVTNIAGRRIGKTREHIDENSSFSEIAMLLATLEESQLERGGGHQVDGVQGDNFNRG